MKPPAYRFHVSVLASLLGLLLPRCANGDGGIIRLQESQGAFSITVFSSPNAVSGGLTDLSALIQERESGKVVLDADVLLSLSPPSGSARVQSDALCGIATSGTRSREEPNMAANVRATREKASNKLLYSAPLALNAPGNWKVHALVSRGSETAAFDCLIPVASSSGTLAGLWPYLSLPPLIVAAFALNQFLRRESLENTLEAPKFANARPQP